MAELSEAESVRRLVDRLGFGAGGDELARRQSSGYAAVVEALLAPSGPDAGAAATPPPRLPPPDRPERGARQGAGAASETTPAERTARKEYRRQLKDQQLTATRWWLDRMVASSTPSGSD